MRQIAHPPPSAAPVAKFRDVQLQFRSLEHAVGQVLLTFLIFALAFILIAGTQWLLWDRVSVAVQSVALIVVAVACFAVFLFRTHRVRRAFLSFVRHQIHGDISDLLQHIAVNNAGADPTWQIRTLAQELARAGRTNETIRVFSLKPPRFEVPYEVHFEPTLLNEADSGFQLIESMRFDALGNLSVTEPARGIRALLTTPLMRNLTLAGGGLALVPLLLTIVLNITSASVGFARGRPGSWQFLIPVVAAIGIVPLALLLRDVPQRFRYFLIPGGLVTRRASPGKSGSEVTVFDRRGCVLGLCRGEGSRWNCQISDRDKSVMFHLTERESIVLLRAWLSPIPPPTVEKLVDLT